MKTAIKTIAFLIAFAVSTLITQLLNPILNPPTAQPAAEAYAPQDAMIEYKDNGTIVINSLSVPKIISKERQVPAVRRADGSWLVIGYKGIIFVDNKQKKEWKAKR